MHVHALDDQLAVRDLEELRKRLIDLTGRNRLIHLPHEGRSSVIRFVGTPLRTVLEQLLSNDGGALALAPLPEDEKVETEAEQTKNGAGEAREATADGPPSPPNPVAVARAHGIDPSYDLVEEGSTCQASLSRADTRSARSDRIGRTWQSRLQTLLFPAQLEAKAESLRRKAKEADEERGIEILKLVIGVLEWPDQDGAKGMNLSPLLLLPVQLNYRVNAKTQRREFTLVANGNTPEHNEALALRLRNDFGITLPRFESEDGESEISDVVLRYLAKMRDVAAAQRNWTAHTWLTLAPLSFAKIAIWRDLDASRWPDRAPATHALVRPLLRSSKEGGSSLAEPISVGQAENDILTPHLVMDADSSQHTAIIDAMRGRSFVIQGPPGTGKSQTIVNLIANAIAAGKRVLFVSEKRAALDVVHNRLVELGLDLFALPLHSAEAAPKVVMERLRKRLNLTENGKVADVRPFDQDVQMLNRHVDTVKAKIGPSGETTVDLIGQTLLHMPSDQARHEALRRASDAMPMPITSDDVAHGQRVLRAIEDAASRLGSEGVEADASPFSTLGRYDLLPDEADALFDRLEEVRRTAIEADKLAVRLLTTLRCTKVARTPSRLQDLANKLSALGPPPAALSPAAFAALPAGALASLDVVKHLGEMVRTADQASKAEAYLKDAGIDAAKIDLCALRALETAAAEAAAPSSLALGDIAAFAEAARGKAERVDALASLARRVSALVGLPSGLRRQEIEALARIADAAAQLDPSAIGDRHPDLAADAEKLAKVAQHASALLRRANPVIDRIAWDGLGADHATAMRGAAATLQRWSLFTSWTAEGKGARAVLRRYWTGTGPLPKPQVGAQLLELSAELIIETQRLIEDPLVARWRPGVKRLPALSLEPLAAAATWQARLPELLGSGVPRTIGRWLVSAPSESFQEVANAAQDLRELADMLAQQSGGVEALCRCTREAAKAANELQNCFSRQQLPWALTLGELPTVREAVERVKAAEAFASDPLWAKLFGGPGLPSREALAAAAALVKYVLTLHRSIPEAATALLREDAFDWPAIEQARSDLVAALSAHAGAVERLTPFGAVSILPSADLPLEERVSACTSLAQGRALLAPTLDWLGRLAEADSLSLTSPLARLLREGTLAPRDLDSALTWCVARRCLLAHADANRDVFQRSGNDLDQARQRFQQADRQLLNVAAKRVCARLLEFQPPRGSNSGKKRDWTEMALVENELTKKGRFVKLRRLMDQAFNAITTLKPCVMMSPLTVAELLPARYDLFDLVVMDEASQIRPEDAFGALLRSKQAVIVGDPQQLPPTTFFDRLISPSAAEDEDEESDEAIVAESVLDLAERAFSPSRRLLWHYRSRHESLIAFSNRHFYDDSLIIFPAPRAPGEDVGVELRHVGGIWRGESSRRVNVEEARAVVEAVADLVKRAPDRSIGVVTMNLAQRDLVEQELNRRASKDQGLADYLRNWEQRTDPREPLFVKNLENIQGDERDIVLISLGYGRTAEGVLHQRFMPIQRAADGHRRLNVLFTRARSKVILFSSIRPEEILVDGRARGVAVLRDYLIYARDGRLETGTEQGEPESPFEEAVRRVLVDRGYDVACQVGVKGYRIDLAIRHPQDRARFVLGIECDGATYHSSKNARDRDRLRQENLERLGWRIVRIWSTDWFRDPEGAARSLIKSIEQAIAETRPATSVVKKAAASATMPPAVLPPQRSAKPPASLVEALIDFRENHIFREMPEADRARGILRRAMLREIVRTHLDDPDDFHRKIPQSLRVGTEGEQVKRFLPEICDIVARYPPNQPLPD